MYYRADDVRSLGQHYGQNQDYEKVFSSLIAKQLGPFIHEFQNQMARLFATTILYEKIEQLEGEAALDLSYIASNTLTLNKEIALRLYKQQKISTQEVYVERRLYEDPSLGYFLLEDHRNVILMSAGEPELLNK